LRGGSWFKSAKYCRTAYRYRLVPAFRENSSGFRVVFNVD
jgi:formylglycine-generating enzyme required for sulfatase activity